MNTVTAAHTDVTLSAAPSGARYPSTTIGALQKACGWLFLTRRYMDSLPASEVARKAGLPGYAAASLVREAESMHEFPTAEARQAELDKVETRAQPEAAQ